jgi:hypothetical protein
MRHTIVSRGLMMLLVALLALPAIAEEWGTLKGKFIYDGTAPPRQELKVTSDIAVCSKHHPMDESLIVGKSGGLANVVVYLRPQRGTELPVRPEDQAKAKEPVVLDNHFCRFDPHIVLVQSSQPILIKNSDPTAHNVKADCIKNNAFNLLLPSGKQQDVILPLGERLPVSVSCNIHPWMSGYLIVRDDPFMAISATDGSFVIRNIPAGTHEFQFWQEKSGYLKNIVFNGGKADARGRAKITIGSGMTDLGEIKVSPSLFLGK